MDYISLKLHKLPYIIKIIRLTLWLILGKERNHRMYTKYMHAAFTIRSYKSYKDSKIGGMMSNLPRSRLSHFQFMNPV